MSYLAIDCGTSACKAAVVTREGRIVALARRPVRLHRPGRLCAEMDPEEVWAAVAGAGRAALRQAPQYRRRIAAVGVSTLLGYVCLDRFERPLAPAMIWMDNRAVAEAEEIRRRIGDKTLHARSGRRVSPELLAPKLMWLKRRRPGIHRRTRTVIGLKDEMVRRLTGAVGTDCAHLDYSLLFDIRRGRIDAGLAAELGIDPALFPPPRRAAEAAGGLLPEAAARLGLPAGIPVVRGSSDGTTAMYGGGVLAPGTAVLVAGTTDVLMTAAAAPVRDRSRSLTVNTGMVPGMWLAGGAMGLSGGAVRHIEHLVRRRMRPLAEKIGRLPPGAEGLLMLPGLSGERAPFWMPHAAGCLAGLTLRHGPEHVFRAAMEGAALRTAILLDRLRSCGLAPSRLAVVGGGADCPAWNRIRADAAGITVVRTRAAEATALGTAMFCRAADDPGTSLAEITRRWVRPAQTFRPDPQGAEVWRRMAGLFEDCLNSAEAVFKELSQGELGFASNTEAFFDKPPRAGGVQP